MRGEGCGLGSQESLPGGKGRSTRRLNCVLQICSQWVALADLWSAETIWQQDAAKLADGFWEESLKKGAAGKEAEADVEQLACPSHSGCRDG